MPEPMSPHPITPTFLMAMLGDSLSDRARARAAGGGGARSARVGYRARRGGGGAASWKGSSGQSALTFTFTRVFP